MRDQGGASRRWSGRLLRLLPLAGLVAGVALGWGAASPAQALGPNAMVPGPDFTANTLPANDDGSTGLVPIGFSINFFGNTVNSLYVNNNGNLTFTGPMSTYTPFPIVTTGVPIIAPFFADVDTRAPGSALVKYGPGVFEGRPAFGAVWPGVGCYGAIMPAAGPNWFQVVIVDRSDVGAGDFDLVFNYDQIKWETGTASGGTSQCLAGDSVRVGYSNGSTAAFELPGSAVNGAFLDGGPTALVSNSLNSLQLGRYRFAVRNGAAPVGGTISGHVFGNPPANNPPVPGALVQVCNPQNFCNLTQTDATGAYSVPGLTPGMYSARAFPPAGSTLLPGGIGPLTLPPGRDLPGQDIQLNGPHGLPPGTSIGPSHPGGGGIPIVYWHDRLTLTTTGCPGGTATYQVLQGATVLQSGPMSEAPPGTYTAVIPPFFPQHGEATVAITILCPDGSTQVIDFTIYIDPSGTVRNAATLAPIPGATVTLLRSDSSSGPFLVVPDGSAVMSPVNRDNPDTTDAVGHFGWDVIAGFYQVSATAPGCSSATSAVLPIPPPVTDLELLLTCVSLDSTPPSIAPVITGTLGANNWYTSNVDLSWLVSDPESPVTSQTGCGPSTLALDGTQGYTCTATSAGGTGSHAITIRRDATPPSISGAPTSSPNASGWFTSPVTIHWTCTDGGSGVASCPADTTVPTEGQHQQVRGTATDGAGLSSFFDVFVDIDLTAPSISGAPTTSPNANGWFTSPVTIHWTCADSGGSGVASCPADTTVPTEGQHQQVRGTATDGAGLSSFFDVFVDIDLTAPVTTASPNPGPNAGGWNNTSVAVALACTDNLSGCALTEYNLDGAGYLSYTVAINLTTEGVHTLLYRSTDRAGNTEAARTLTVRIDKTAPEAYNQFDPATKNVLVYARDAGAGVSAGPIGPTSVTPTRWGGDPDEDDDEDDDHGGRGNAELRTYRITDLAGNTLVLVEKVKRGGREVHEIKVHVISLQYNGGPVITPPKNAKKYEWSLNKDGTVKELEQKLEVGQGRTKQEVEAKFDSKKNQTTIKTEEPRPERKVTVAGLVLLRLATANGSLTIEY